MLSPKVTTSPGTVVVTFPKSDWGVEMYILAHGDVSYPGAQFIEVVVNGFVRDIYTEDMNSAPVRIIQLIKKWGNTCVSQ